MKKSELRALIRECINEIKFDKEFEKYIETEKWVLNKTGEYSREKNGETETISKKELQDRFEQIRYMTQEMQLNEYIVKKGYSLEAWKKLSDSERQKIVKANKSKSVWRVVHGHKTGEVGKPINSYKDEEGNTKYTNYEKARKIHSAIVLGGK